MTKNQRKVLKQAFALLRIGATQGIDLASHGTLAEARRHVADLEQMVVTMKRTMDEAVAAGAVLDRVKAIR